MVYQLETTLWQLNTVSFNTHYEFWEGWLRLGFIINIMNYYWFYLFILLLMFKVKHKLHNTNLLNWLDEFYLKWLRSLLRWRRIRQIFWVRQTSQANNYCHAKDLLTALRSWTTSAASWWKVWTQATLIDRFCLFFLNSGSHAGIMSERVCLET